MSWYGFKMRVVIQSKDWNPFESYLLMAAVLAGFSGLFFPDESSRIVVETMPHWTLVVWYVGLIVGGVVALIGVHINIRDKIEIETIGISVLTFVTIGYTSVLSFVSGRPLSYPILLTGFFSLACISRIIQLLSKLRKLYKGGEVTL